MANEYTEEVRCTSCYSKIEGIRSDEKFRDEFRFNEDAGLHCPECVKKIQAAVTDAETTEEAFRDFLSELVLLADKWPEGAPSADLAHIVGTWAQVMQAAQNHEDGATWPAFRCPDQSRRQFPAPIPPVVLSARFEAEHARTLLL